MPLTDSYSKTRRLGPRPIGPKYLPNPSAIKARVRRLGGKTLFKVYKHIHDNIYNLNTPAMLYESTKLLSKTKK